MKCSICYIVLSLCGKRVPLFFVLFYCAFALFLSILIYGNSEFSEETDEPVELRLGGVRDFSTTNQRFILLPALS